MSEPIRYKKNPDVSWRSIENQAVLIHNRQGEIMVLNDVGTYVWENAEKDPDTLAGNIAEMFEVSIDEARRDVLEFLEALKDSGALLHD